MTLFEHIRKQIQDQGPIPFSDFMQQALYNPIFGYYSAGLQKFGKGGDFITAPELTPLFGQTLANQCQQILTLIDHPIIFEFGAGSGKLCVDILQHLEYLNCLPDEYHILEVSSNLRYRQEEFIQQTIPHLANRIQWHHHWPVQRIRGVIIANEVLDAMPVARFLRTAEGLFEHFVTLNETGELADLFQPCVNQRLNDHINMIITPDLYPYHSEVNLFINDWIQQCHDMLEIGAVLLLDYGFPRHEYYHPDRYQGTLMCHYQHRAHPQPLIHLGEQDITAHVDFTHVADAALDAGFHVAGYTNQASFLLANGLLNLLQDMQEGPERVRHQEAVKQLLQLSEMGELFKVMALTKQLDLALTGFQLSDKRASL